MHMHGRQPEAPEVRPAISLPAITESSSVAVTAPDAIALVSSSSPALCHGSLNGSASVAATGGTSPYNYSWSPSGGSNAMASNLAAGTYTVLVTDNHGCTKSTSASVGQPAPVVLNANGNATICIGQSAQINSGATGGPAPYTFLWSNGATTS